MGTHLAGDLVHRERRHLLELKALTGAHVFLGHADHELNAVELVDLGRAGVVVHRDDVALGMLTAQLLDHGLAHHVIGQARKGLRADDVGRTVINQVEHLGREQPALAHVVAHRKHRAGFVRHGADALGCLKAAGLFEHLLHRRAHPVHELDERLHARARSGRASQLVLLQLGVAHGVQEEVEQARHHGLAALALDHIDHVVVGCGVELDQDLTDHAHARLGTLAHERHGVERADGLTRKLGVVVAVELRRQLTGARHVLLVERVGGTGRGLVRAAAIEHLHHPELAGKPLAVGGDPEARHGIVLTADYIAKRYGVKTGMALWQAKEVCPDITFVSPRMDLYLRFSRMAHEIYAEYTDRQEPYGIDECWLDVTGSSSLKGDGLLIAQEISRRMKSELGITVSVGVSFNKIFAKLGSDYKKPDAITTMYKSEFKQKAWSLPVADLLYVGKSTNRKLALFGIKTIGDLARADEDVLNSHLGKMGSILWSFANGYDDSPVKLENTHAPIKSVGNSTTTPKDLVCDEDVKIVLYILAESVAARLRENGFRCRVVEISVRDNELFSFTRQKKIDHATNITGEIAAYAYQIFKENYNWSKPIRSVGVRGADLVTDNYWEQIDLFSSVERREKQMKMDSAVDEIRKRFGFYSIQRGLMYRDRILSAVNAKEEHTVHPHGYFG